MKHSADGRELARREIRAEAGPGADDTIRAIFPADTDVKG